jgi:SP family arabinose:H+ symporter-like MFS transporter
LDDVSFKNDIRNLIGTNEFSKREGEILELSIKINSILVLLGIIGFIACFAFSLGPVMWVMLSELFPNMYRGLAIGVIGFVNSFTSWFIQQVFPWELSNLGASITFLIYGLIAVIGLLIFIKILPETKGKSLEQIEFEFIKK